MSEEQRIEIVLKNPNPLFTKWLTVWANEAKKKGSKTQYIIREALESLKRYPLPLETGRDCAILKGFGPKLCMLLDQKLEEYKVNNLEDYNKSLNYGNDVKEIAKKMTKKKAQKLGKDASPTKKKLPKEKSKDYSNLEDEQILMSPGTFKIILLVDTMETLGKNKKTLDETLLYLNSQQIAYEVRRLGAGDFCWICTDEAERELLLPYIIERKRMDDFASSIRDGRFHEQKFRLRESKIQNLIYLIESYGSNQHVGLPMTTLLQAAANTQIHSGFQIKFTESHRESLLYIATLTRILIERFKGKVLIGVSKEEIKPVDLIENGFIGLMKFREFNERSSKARSFTVREIFVKQLLQLKSLSVDKALAITEVYSTPRILLTAYANCASTTEAEKLLSKIPSGVLRRPVGLAISKTIYQFYCGTDV